MRSEFKGHCQACGRLQMLPSGVLSKHGYTVTYGFFSGVCPGTKHRPFEESYDMLPDFIATAQKELEAVEAFISKLRTPAVEPRCWVYNYEGSIYGRNSYVWREVEIAVEDRGTYKVYSYVANGTNGKTAVVHKIEDYSYGRDSVFNIATKQNENRAKNVEKEAKSLRRYIAWQEERIATWKPAELLPVSSKDKLGFVVEE